MSPAARTILPRYWRDRTDKAAYDDESVALHAAELGLDIGLKRIDAAVLGECSVLLGPPGSGKTTDLQQLESRSPERTRLVSLGSTSSEERLHSKIQAALTALNETATTERPVLILDSVDETTMRTTQLAGFFEDVLKELPGNVSLAVACRSAAWLPGVEHVLRQKYSDVAIYDLAPLSGTDIVAYADSAGAAGNDFLAAVQAAKCLPLAVSPNTLGLLVDEYLAGGGGALPATQKELYERSCQRLIQEPNPLRQITTGATQRSRTDSSIGGTLRL